MFRNRKRRPKVEAEPRCNVPRECVGRMKDALDAMPTEQAQRFAGAAMLAGLKATRSMLDFAINKVEERSREGEEVRTGNESNQSFTKINID